MGDKEVTKRRNKGKKRILKGKVLSNKMEKTVVVQVESKDAHPLYRKIIKKYKNFKAHSEEEIDIGRTVKIAECRPISKHKTWRVVEVID